MTDDNDKKPQKKPRRVVKRKKKEVNEDPKETELDESFKKKIQLAIQTNLSDYAKKRNLSKKQISIINSFIEEHLSCFVVLGYTVAGDPVTLVNAKTQKDSDSLGTLIQKFLVKYIDPPPPPPHI